MTLRSAALARLSELGRPGRVLAPALDIALEAKLGTRTAWRDRERTLQTGPAVRRNVYRRIWSDAAERVGAHIEPLGDDFFVMRRGVERTVVSYHQVQLDNAVDILLALDRGIVHERLGTIGVPVSKYVEVPQTEPAEARRFLEEFGPCVVKPARGSSGGAGITCGIETEPQLRRALVWARRWDTRRAIVEQQAMGSEVRLLFLDGELLGILHRRPPTITGDGHSTAIQLLAAENRRRTESDGHAGMRSITADLDCVFALARSGHTLRSTVPSGRVVPAKATVNESGSLDSHTVPRHAVSDTLVREASSAARAVGVRLAAVEIITPDPRRSLADAGGVVLEVNGTPGLHYHYTVSEPESATRVAVPILECLLTGRSRPVAVSGATASRAHAGVRTS